jgi:membrane-bound ClpP family serine protease
VIQRSPLYEAQHADRYERQRLISVYEEAFGCRLVVLVDAIFGYSVTLFEELVCDADSAMDLHLLLWTPGGDGEIAVRLTRAAQARCQNLTVIVPDQAKSAGTLLALGAHHILMGPTSDLGPVDPQFEIKPGSPLVSAKDIIAAVDDATKKVQEAPETYPLYASLLSDVTALMVQQARSALDRTTDLLEEALKSNPDRAEEEVAALKAKLKERLVDVPQTHSAILGAKEAARIGLPVIEADAASEQWRAIWRLWARYFALGCRVYEGARVSQVTPWATAT